MDWQQVASLVIVTCSALLLVRYEVRRQQRVRNNVCGHDCGCSVNKYPFKAEFAELTAGKSQQKNL